MTGTINTAGDDVTAPVSVMAPLSSQPAGDQHLQQSQQHYDSAMILGNDAVQSSSRQLAAGALHPPAADTVAHTDVVDGDTPASPSAPAATDALDPGAPLYYDMSGSARNSSALENTAVDLRQIEPELYDDINIGDVITATNELFDEEGVYDNVTNATISSGVEAYAVTAADASVPTGSEALAHAPLVYDTPVNLAAPEMAGVMTYQNVEPPQQIDESYYGNVDVDASQSASPDIEAHTEVSTTLHAA